eukprot:TRINITY_DN17169_c0_g1_i3.p1 TRINITY_DN17169_c0_g1~~TRINITY_DN17169_c0_g1_i3.p1  ORF type:complete len:434 (+),score=103.38 TRINITY_DN17169_c0_g1_i3:184-1485(+)
MCIRDSFRDHRQMLDECPGESWSAMLGQHREGCSEEEFACLEAAVAGYEQHMENLNARRIREGAFTLVHGNFHPLQLEFPHSQRGPASPPRANCDGGVLAWDWSKCGLGAPTRDLFMALVPWMTYLPREFCGEQEKKLVNLYHQTLLKHGVRGFPKSQLWHEFALEGIAFVPRLFELIELDKASPVGPLLHCAHDFDFSSHLLVSYSDMLSRHGSVDFAAAVKLEGVSLIRAFQNQDLALINQLLDGGYPNINEVDVLGISPLGFGAYLGNMQLIELVLEQPTVNLNIMSGAGATPLTTAARHGRTDAAIRLIQAGASVDLVNKERGLSPLIFAACNGDLKLATALVEAGADIGLRCKNGKTAVEYAQREKNSGSQQVATLLQNSQLCTHTTAKPWCEDSASPRTGLMCKVNHGRRQQALHVPVPHPREWARE